VVPVATSRCKAQASVQQHKMSWSPQQRSTKLRNPTQISSSNSPHGCRSSCYSEYGGFYCRYYNPHAGNGLGTEIKETEYMVCKKTAEFPGSGECATPGATCTMSGADYTCTCPLGFRETKRHYTHDISVAWSDLRHECEDLGPTDAPTSAPTSSPTTTPTAAPSGVPTSVPTAAVPPVRTRAPSKTVAQSRVQFANQGSIRKLPLIPAVRVHAAHSAMQAAPRVVVHVLPGSTLAI
jgi:hypothetical protein